MHTYAGRLLSTGQLPLATVGLSDWEAQTITGNGARADGGLRDSTPQLRDDTGHTGQPRRGTVRITVAVGGGPVYTDYKGKPACTVPAEARPLPQFVTRIP